MPRNSPNTPHKDRKLTQKERRLCEEMMVDGNKRQAAIRAGYSPTSAAQLADETLKKPQVKAYYKALLSAQAAKTKITGEKVINELAAIAFFQLPEIVEIKDNKLSILETKKWSPFAKRAVESIKIDKDGAIAVKAHGKVSALTKLGDHFGMFTDYNVAIAALSRYGYVTELTDGEKGFEFRECLPEENAIGQDEDDEEDC